MTAVEHDAQESGRRLRGLMHTTVDGIRYGIDADGTVTAPDADGRPDTLVLGWTRRRTGRLWTLQPFDRTGRPRGVELASGTRRGALRLLVAEAEPAVSS